MEYVNPNGLQKPSSYSQAVKAGGLLIISGQIPVDEQGNLLHVGNAEAQARLAFANLKAVLQAAGGSFRNVLKTTVFMNHPDHRPLINKVRMEHWIETFGDGPYPGNTNLIVTSLYDPQCTLELEAIAVTEER